MKRSFLSVVILAVATMFSSLVYADVGAGSVGYNDVEPVYTVHTVMSVDPTDTVSAAKPNNDGAVPGDSGFSRIAYFLMKTTDNRIPGSTVAVVYTFNISDVPTKIPITV